MDLNKGWNGNSPLCQCHNPSIGWICKHVGVLCIGGINTPKPQPTAHSVFILAKQGGVIPPGAAWLRTHTPTPTLKHSPCVGLIMVAEIQRGEPQPSHGFNLSCSFSLITHTRQGSHVLYLSVSHVLIFSFNLFASLLHCLFSSYLCSSLWHCHALSLISSLFLSPSVHFLRRLAYRIKTGTLPNPKSPKNPTCKCPQKGAI